VANLGELGARGAPSLADERKQIDEVASGCRASSLPTVPTLLQLHCYLDLLSLVIFHSLPTVSVSILESLDTNWAGP
jgi:hypothetical protein